VSVVVAALRDGGSGLDAPIVANAVFNIVVPDQPGIGGDCFLIYFEKASGRLSKLNGSGCAPAAGDCLESPTGTPYGLPEPVSVNSR
jgi:gamma-glutamyltranspeptidase/glutathione hydrolase